MATTLKILAAVVLAYGLLTAVAHLVCGSILFQPHYGSRRAPPGAFRLHGENGETLSAVYLPNPQARATLWYFHGNAEDLGDVYPHLLELRDHGFAVFALDYPGYGTSDGRPTEQTLYAANRAGWAWLQNRPASEPRTIIFHGRSVGAGPATQAAVEFTGAGLILESAFTSAYRVMLKWPMLPWDKFANLRKLADVKCPVLVIHGQADRVIPFAHGERLYAAATGAKQHLWVDFAGHNDLHQQAGQSYWRAVAVFAALVEHPTRTSGASPSNSR